MKKVFCWIFGCIFALLALLSLKNAHLISFLFEAFVAVLLLPPANKYLNEGLKLNFPQWITPTAISLYIIFAIAMGSINMYNAAAPFLQPFIRMSKELQSYNRQPLEGVTTEQREGVEKFQAEIAEFANKLKTLNQIKNEKIKREKLIEYSEEIKEMEIPEELPEEIESLLVDSKQDFNTAFEKLMKNEEMTKEDFIYFLNTVIDGFIKVSKASRLAGIVHSTED